MRKALRPRWAVWLVGAVMLLVLTAACGETVVKEVVREVEKIVEVEVVKEVPVEKQVIVEKEVVREVTVDKIVEVEVIKEIEVIKEVPAFETPKPYNKVQYRDANYTGPHTVSPKPKK